MTLVQLLVELLQIAGMTFLIVLAGVATLLMTVFLVVLWQGLKGTLKERKKRNGSSSTTVE